jgi:hypothetical protein
MLSRVFEVLRIRVEMLLESYQCYFDGLGEDERVHWIEDALDKNRWEEEGEEWLAGEARRRSIILEQIHQGGDDTF